MVSTIANLLESENLAQSGQSEQYITSSLSVNLDCIDKHRYDF